MKKTVGYEGNTNSGKGEWLTPPWLILSLPEFDLDPCAPKIRPWDTAKHHYYKNGLSKEWFGKVWLNPPYDNTEQWFLKGWEHNNTIALCFNRTETKWFYNAVWSRANGILFIAERLHFHHVDGSKGNNGSGAGSVLIAYGNQNCKILRESGLGKYFDIN